MSRPVPGVLALALAVVMGAGLGAAPAFAEPSPTPVGQASPTPNKGEPVCVVKNESLREASGLAVTGSGFAVLPDGNVNQSRLQVFFLDGACKATTPYRTNRDPSDPEDLALAADGSVWVADIGDNNRNRATVALFRVPPNRGRAALYRLKYPDGAHDAEALLLGASGVPVIVTKDPATAGVYVPAGPLVADKTVDLKRVGEFKIPKSDTSGGPGAFGRFVVTGGAVSPDGRKAVVRTYTDAYEFDVTNNDVAGALTKGQPRATPLPDERHGEAIAYSRDGRTFLTISELVGEEDQPIREYTPAAPSRQQGGAAASPKPVQEKGFVDRTLDWLGVDGIKRVIGGIGVVGLLLVVFGITGIRRSRKRRRADAVAARTRPRPTDDVDTAVIPRMPNGDEPTRIRPAPVTYRSAGARPDDPPFPPPPGAGTGASGRASVRPPAP